MASTEIQQMLAAAAAACDDKKAEDIRILALDPAESGLADYFLVCNGTNERQNVAITDEIEIRLKRDFGTYPQSVEGRRNGEWILMDYFNFIVHVFSPEKRAFYGLERLRKSATTLSVEDLNAEIKAEIVSTRKRHAKPDAGAEGGTAAKTPRIKVKSVGVRAVKATKAVPAKRSAKKTATKSSTKRSPKKKLSPSLTSEELTSEE